MTFEHLSMIVMALLLASAALLALLLRVFLAGRSTQSAALRIRVPGWWRLSLSRETVSEGSGKPGSSSSGRQRLRGVKPVEQDLDMPGCDDTTYCAHQVARLEQLFALLERGRITLVTYRGDLAAIRREVFLRVQELEAASLQVDLAPVVESQLADTREALKAVDWCLEWASLQQADAVEQANAGLA